MGRLYDTAWQRGTSMKKAARRHFLRGSCLCYLTRRVQKPHPGHGMGNGDRKLQPDWLSCHRLMNWWVLFVFFKHIYSRLKTKVKYHSAQFVV